MAFKKADPQQARLKASVYGPPGSGKTFSSLLMAEGLAKHRQRRVAVIDTERGTDFYAMAVAERGVHPAAFDFDAIYTKSLAMIVREVKALDPAVYGVVILDSISHVWDAAQEAYEGKRGGKDGDKIPFGAWAQIKKPYKDLLRFLMESPFDVFICGRQKTLYEDNGNDIKKIGVAMRAEGETQHEPHLCLRMEAAKNPQNPLTSVYMAHVEKDRTGVLSGKMLVNPSFTSITALLPLLGEKQAQGEDEDERIAADGELLDQQDDKAATKAVKSSELLTEYQAKIMAASDPAAIGAVAAAIDKQKRYMLAEHLETLRALFNVKRDQVANKFMGAAKPQIGS